MKNFTKGITLIELTVIVAVVLIMIAITFPTLSKMKQNQVLKNAVEDVISASQKAKSQTLASLNSYNYGVHLESDKIVIFRGTTYSAGDSYNEVINIISPATISNISLSGGGTDLYFNRLTGVPNKSGQVTVSIESDPSYTKTITISTNGAVSLN